MDLLRSVDKINKFLGGKNILVLYGGRSSEKDASLRTGKRIVKCLMDCGIKTILFNPEEDMGGLVDKANNSGLVFLGLHGGYGEDGTIQGLLDFYRIPFTGSGILGSGVGMNKLITKRILRSEGVSTADYVVWSESIDTKDFVDRSEKKLGYPLMMKIWDEGSGNGVFLIDDRETFENKLNGVKELDKVFAEKYITGREMSVGVIEISGKTVVLPVLEVLYKGYFFDLKIRSDPKKYQKIIPAKMEPDVENKVKDVCRYAHKILGANVYSRIDLKLEEGTNIPYLLEITTLPGLTDTSWYPEMAEIGKLSFSELVLLIILASIDKYES
jgi:D-alanine-D-alanine ligase